MLPQPPLHALFPFGCPAWRGSPHEDFVLRRVGLCTAATAAPSSALHSGVPGAVGGALFAQSLCSGLMHLCNGPGHSADGHRHKGAGSVVCFVLRPAPCSRYELLGALRRACFFAAKGSQPKSVESHKLSHKHGVRYSRRAGARGASFRGGANTATKTEVSRRGGLEPIPPQRL